MKAAQIQPFTLVSLRCWVPALLRSAKVCTKVFFSKTNVAQFLRHQSICVCATGPKGDAGNTGPSGAVGAIGFTGAQGRKGDRGPAGAPGSGGSTGFTG